MPFKSQAQQRAAFGGHLGPEMKKKAPEWAHETPNISKLPKHVRREDSPMQQEAPVEPMEATPMQQAPMADTVEMEIPAVDPNVHPGCDDQVGDIYVVLKPNPESTAEDILHKTHAFGVKQFDPQTVHGIYNSEGEASLVAEGAVKELHKHLTEVEKKKDEVLEKIAKHIHRLQKEINEHMKSANARPEEDETHHVLAQRKMDIIKNLRDKHKAVKSSKRELPKKDEK